MSNLEWLLMLQLPLPLFQLSESLNKAYCISEISEADTMDLVEALTKIRLLLSVKLGHEEEGMIIKGLK